MKNKPIAVSFDRTGILLVHNSINDIDPHSNGLVLLYGMTAEKGGTMPKRLHWGFGNIRQELSKAAKIPSIAAFQFIYFNYKVGATASQFQEVQEHLPVNSLIDSE